MGITRRKPNPSLTPFVRITQSNDGFTLLELIMVTAILAALAFAALGGIAGFREKAKISRAAAEIRGLEKDIINYATEKGTYPTSLHVSGMIALIDPWGNEYEYRLVPARTCVDTINTDFDLFSKGPNGDFVDSITEPVSKDDIIRGNDGSFVGLADKYGTP